MALMIPIIAVLIPIVAILVTPYKARLKTKEREEARKMYERIAMEKLDVIKTAASMGIEGNELAELDARLEKLVGSEKLASLLDEKQPMAPQASTELRDADLDDELAKIKRLRKERQ